MRWRCRGQVIPSSSLRSPAAFLVALMVLAVPSCMISGFDLDTYACPCAEGWYCSEVTNTCKVGPEPLSRSFSVRPGRVVLRAGGSAEVLLEGPAKAKAFSVSIAGLPAGVSIAPAEAAWNGTVLRFGLSATRDLGDSTVSPTFVRAGDNVTIGSFTLEVRHAAGVLDATFGVGGVATPARLPVDAAFVLPAGPRLVAVGNGGVALSMGVTQPLLGAQCALRSMDGLGRERDLGIGASPPCALTWIAPTGLRAEGLAVAGYLKSDPSKMNFVRWSLTEASPHDQKNLLGQWRPLGRDSEGSLLYASQSEPALLRLDDIRSNVSPQRAQLPPGNRIVSATTPSDASVWVLTERDGDPTFRVTRILSTGVIDPGLQEVAVGGDARFMVSDHSSVFTVTRSGTMKRLRFDGTPEATDFFEPSPILKKVGSTPLARVLTRPQGGFLFSWEAFEGTSHGWLTVVKADGSFDDAFGSMGFAELTQTPSDMVMDSEGRVVIASLLGTYTQPQGVVLLRYTH